jgi:hypothetical protein
MIIGLAGTHQGDHGVYAIGTGGFLFGVIK